MQKGFRQCSAAGRFNTGQVTCPLQPDKIKGIILVQHGYKLPAELTAEAFLEACHADYPNRIYPIKGIVEYAPSGGEAQVSATGYGPSKVTSYSARTDTFTLGDFNLSLQAMLVSAKSTLFDMFPYDYNNVIYGVNDGTDNLAGIELAGVYPSGQQWTSSGQVAYLAFNALIKDVEKYMQTASVIQADFDLDSALQGLSFVDFVKMDDGENAYKMVEHFDHLDLTPYYGSLIQENAETVLTNNTALTSVNYDSQKQVITVGSAITPLLATPSTLYESGIKGIEQWS